MPSGSQPTVIPSSAMRSTLPACNESAATSLKRPTGAAAGCTPSARANIVAIWALLAGSFGRYVPLGKPVVTPAAAMRAT